MFSRSVSVICRSGHFHADRDEIDLQMLSQLLGAEGQGKQASVLGVAGGELLFPTLIFALCTID